MPADTAEAKGDAVALMQWSELVWRVMQEAAKGIDEDPQIVASSSENQMR